MGHCVSDWRALLTLYSELNELVVTIRTLLTNNDDILSVFQQQTTSNSPVAWHVC